MPKKGFISDAPPFMRAAVRGALVQTLRRLRTASSAPDSTDAARAWKLFMLLAHTEQQGSQRPSGDTSRTPSKPSHTRQPDIAPRRNCRTKAASGLREGATGRTLTRTSGAHCLRPGPRKRGYMGRIDRPRTPPSRGADRNHSGRPSAPAVPACTPELASNRRRPPLRTSGRGTRPFGHARTS